MQASWTYEGHMPGPLLRVTEGDTVTIVLTNDAANKNSRSIDLHAAQMDVLRELSDVQTGQTKTLPLLATSLDTCTYNSGAAPMHSTTTIRLFGGHRVVPQDPHNRE